LEFGSCARLDAKDFWVGKDESQLIFVEVMHIVMPANLAHAHILTDTDVLADLCKVLSNGVLLVGGEDDDGMLILVLPVQLELDASVAQPQRVPKLCHIGNARMLPNALTLLVCKNAGPFGILRSTMPDFDDRVIVGIEIATRQRP
jgi:hypothetical protein